MPLKRIGFAVALALVLLAYLGYQALWDPKIEFLRPSLRGQWIVHPNLPIQFRPFPACPDALFTHRFPTTEDAATEIRVTAQRVVVLRLNGKRIDKPYPTAWKRGQSYDLRPYLKPTGENLIEIQVSGYYGPPALLVEGSPALRSDTRWQVALMDKPDATVQAARALRDEVQLREKWNPLRTSPRFPLYAALLGLYLAGIAYTLLRRPARAFSPAHRLVWRFWCEYGLSLLLFGIAVVVQFHNVLRYPYSRSYFDWQGHVEYIQYMAQHWRAPLATDGWEMFQPPLYYFTSAILYRLAGGAASEPASLKAIQIYTTWVGLGNIALGWGMLRLIFPANYRARNLGFSVIALLPMGFYMNSMISNEIFAGGVIGLAIYLAARFGASRRISWREALIIGIGCGLALLAKYTGLFIFLSVLCLVALRLLSRRMQVRWAVLLLAVTVVICGWFYLRNLRQFRDPFIGNWDEATGFHYEQPPGYRNVSFYTRFGSVLTHLPERSRWSSFWDGNYASMWTDTHGTFLDLADAATQRLGSFSLWLALLPALAILLGFGMAVRRLIFEEWDHPLLLLVLTSVLTVVSLISFTMEVPTYSTIKAFFFLSLLSSLGVFASLGLENVCQRLGTLRWVVYAHLILLHALNVYLFWYRGS